jgi:hypothetical protein
MLLLAKNGHRYFKLDQSMHGMQKAQNASPTGERRASYRKRRKETMAMPIN